jgi:uncharacterized protein with PIN domain/sulfur carrier protein ThiS
MKPEKRIAYFRVYSYLNDLIHKLKRYKRFPIEYRGRQSVKHLIESSGIPHTEVDLVLVNGQPVDFSYITQEQDRVSVFPHFSRLVVPDSLRMQQKGSGDMLFAADGHLGHLARYLRMLGYDTFYDNEMDDEDLAAISCGENRILLTRDRGLLKRKSIRNGCLVRYRKPIQQLQQVVQRYGLMALSNPFSRCMVCNDCLSPVSKVKVLDELEPKTKMYFNVFKQCNGCGKIYWSGSHHQHMDRIIKDLHMQFDQCENVNNF